MYILLNIRTYIISGKVPSVMLHTYITIHVYDNNLRGFSKVNSVPKERNIHAISYM